MLGAPRITRDKAFVGELRSLANQTLDAVETVAESKSACEVWLKKFKQGAQAERGYGGDVWLQQDLQTWGFFGGVDQRDLPERHYWILFGKWDGHSRQAVVEVNPPVNGINRNVQGVVARDKGGRRWMLHGGRLHPSGRRIREDDFDRVYESKRVEVRYSDGSSKLYHPVVCIDRPAVDVQRFTADFVSACMFIRAFYTGGRQAALLLKKLDDFAKSVPESEKPRTRKALEETIIDPKHARIWKHLAAYLDSKRVKHTNIRVNGWGPDLIAIRAKSILFEIKTESTASDIQKGLGQLLLYEKILGGSYRKVLLLPVMPKPALVNHLEAFEITVKIYGTSGNTPNLSPLASLL